MEEQKIIEKKDEKRVLLQTKNYMPFLFLFLVMCMCVCVDECFYLLT